MPTKRLSICVPIYKEPVDVIKPLLDSIKIQQGINLNNIEIVFAHDGPESSSLPESWFFKDFGIDIIEVWLENHQGVSAARNAALEASHGEYVMFCDADDMFCDVCGLYMIFMEMDKGFDTLVTCFREEQKLPDSEEIIYIRRDFDSTFVHGKVHKRSFLDEKQIRFNPKLTIHEDSYFNVLCHELADEELAKYSPNMVYMWKWRDSSICRHDPDYILKTYGNFIDSNEAVVEEFIRRMNEPKAVHFVGFMVIEAYYTMNKPEWLDKVNIEYRKSVEDQFSRYFKRWRHLYEKLDNQEKMQLSLGIRSRSVMEGMLMEAITLDEWLERISNR